MEQHDEEGKAAKVWRKIWEENKEISEKGYSKVLFSLNACAKEVVEMLKRRQPALELKTMRVACSI